MKILNEEELNRLKQIEELAKVLVGKMHYTNFWRSAVWKKNYVELHNILFQEKLEL